MNKEHVSPGTPVLDRKFKKWSDFLNITIGLLAFTFGLACVATKTPAINATLSMALILCLRVAGEGIFPEEIKKLRKLAKTDPKAKQRLKALMKNYISIKILLTKYVVFLFGYVFLCLIMVSHLIVLRLPSLGPYISAYLGP